LNNDQEKKEKNQTPSQEEREANIGLARSASQGMWESDYQRIETATFEIPKKSSSTYGKQQIFKTTTKEK